MVKIIGAIFIILATTWVGFELAKHLSNRTKQLRMLKSALQSLDAEIMYGHSPLHEASRRISNQIAPPISNLFELFALKLVQRDATVKESWESSLKEIWNMTSLKNEEYEILKQFGETLGKHDRISQQKQIILALTHLEREEQEARDKQLKYERMTKSLGFLTGLLIAIILL